MRTEQRCFELRLCTGPASAGCAHGSRAAKLNLPSLPLVPPPTAAACPSPPALQNEYKGCSKKKDPTCGDCPTKLQTCDVSLNQAQAKIAQQDQLIKVRGGPGMGSARGACRQPH